MKWNIGITSVGNEVIDIFEDGEKIDLVADGRREDMKDFVIHFHGDLPEADLKEKDIISLEGHEFNIVALSEGINEYIREHKTFTLDISGNRKEAKESCTIVTKSRDPRRQLFKGLQKYKEEYLL